MECVGDRWVGICVIFTVFFWLYTHRFVISVHSFLLLLYYSEYSLPGQLLVPQSTLGLPLFYVLSGIFHAGVFTVRPSTTSFVYCSISLFVLTFFLNFHLFMAFCCSIISALALLFFHIFSDLALLSSLSISFVLWYFQ